MRDSILFYINGERHSVSGADTFKSLSDYLRYQLRLIGTKVVCSEGDCGACTVLVGREKEGILEYRTANSCILFLYQLDCNHIITVEGLKQNGNLHPVQKAMVEHHGAQCGFCTPGFVMSMAGTYENLKTPPTVQDFREALTGNLCRCTGYEPILKAAESASWGEKIFRQLYPSQNMLADFSAAALKDIKIEAEVFAEKNVFFQPASSEEASQFLLQNPDARIISGGTDTGVLINKRKINVRCILSLSSLNELSGITLRGDRIEVGALATLSELMEAARHNFPALADILSVFASPQIRNVGTLAGNIANASPIGDAIPLFHAIDGSVELSGPAGRRSVKASDFFTGYRKTDIRAGEFIASLTLPLPGKDDVVKVYKISKRKDLDISTLSAALHLKMRAGRIESARLAAGGVAAVVVRLSRAEAFLKNKEPTLKIFSEAGKFARSEIKPISDVRGSALYRLDVMENIFTKFYYDVFAEKEVD